MKKALCCLLSLLLMLGTFTAYAQADSSFVMAGYEEEDTNRTWAGNLFFARMQEKTGVTFTFEQAKDYEAWQKVKAGYLQSGTQLPDVLFKALLSPAETLLLLDEGILLDLAPLIQDNAPALYALLLQYPDVRAAVTLPDGRIGALPFINLAPSQNCLWINNDWLQALKLEMPATWQELQAVLEAFKADDPNRNARDDEIPLTFLGAYDLKYLAHAWGLAANDFNISAQDGKAVFMPLEVNFRPFITWCRELYQKGLLDPDGFQTVDTLRRVTDAKAAVRYGALFAPLPSSILPGEWLSSYTAVTPLTYEGKQVYRTISPSAIPGTFAITTACQDAAAMLKWADHFYTPEGAILASAGQEGIDYLIDGDGSWRRTPEAEQNDFQANSLILSGSVPPGISNDAFQRRYADTVVRTISEEIDRVAAVARDPFPPFSLSYAQEKMMAPLQSGIGRYVDESIARWVLGEWELSDAQFTQFGQELERLGLGTFMALWQDVLDQSKEQLK